MSCSFCANSIEKALFKQKGIEEVHVSLAHEEALVRFQTVNERLKLTRFWHLKVTHP
jgi:copper chaperone CopZ